MRLIWTDDAGVAAARAACPRTVSARHMPREKDVAVIAVTADESMGADDFEALKEALEGIYPKGLLVGLGGPGAGIRELDRAEMEAEGWVRKEPNPLPSHIKLRFSRRVIAGEETLERVVQLARFGRGSRPSEVVLDVKDLPEAKGMSSMAVHDGGRWILNRLWLHPDGQDDHYFDALVVVRA